jgi:hypothetical protein
MGTQERNISYQVTFSLIVCLLILVYLTVSQSYPYYFVWDMDHSVIIDILLMQSGDLPEHIVHPGFGMNILLYFSQKIAYFLGYLSVLNFEDLSGSLNPLSGYAELAVYNRKHSAFIALGIVIMLWMSFKILFRPPLFVSLLLLILIGCQESLIYHSSMIRSEFYSIFFWSGSILITVLSVKYTSKIWQVTILTTAGIFLGLCLLTKIQSGLYLVVFPIIHFLVILLGDTKGDFIINSTTKKAGIFITGLGCFNAMFFTILLYAAQSITPPHGLWHWQHFDSINPIGMLFVLVVYTVLLFQVFMLFKGRINSWIFQSSYFFSLVFFGFLLSFFLHFLVYPDSLLSLKYMLLDTKMIFFKLKASPIEEYFVKFLNNLFYDPSVFILNYFLVIIISVGYYFKFIRMKRLEVVLCLILAFFCAMNSGISSRYMLRDILWYEIITNFSSLFFLMIILSRAIRFRGFLTFTCCVALIVIISIKFSRSTEMPSRINANYNIYGWKVMFQNTYGADMKYGIFMKSFYGKDKASSEMALEHSERFDIIKRTVAFVFPNLSISHRNIGVTANNYPVWTKDLEYKISKVPSELIGSVLVDTHKLPLNNKGYLKTMDVQRHSEVRDKFKMAPDVSAISILTRRNLEIYLFVQKSDIRRIKNEFITTKDHVISVSKGKNMIDLYALEIKAYSEIPFGNIKKKYFFVIKEKPSFRYN